MEAAVPAAHARDLALQYVRGITDWTGRELAVLEALVRRIQYPTYTAWPSKATLQADTGVSRKTVQRALTTLKEAGEIVQVGTLPMLSNPSRHLVRYAFPKFRRWWRSLVVERFAGSRGLHRIKDLLRTPVPMAPEVVTTASTGLKTNNNNVKSNVNTSSREYVVKYSDTGRGTTTSGATPSPRNEKFDLLRSMASSPVPESPVPAKPDRAKPVQSPVHDLAKAQEEARAYSLRWLEEQGLSTEPHKPPLPVKVSSTATGPDFDWEAAYDARKGPSERRAAEVVG